MSWLIALGILLALAVLPLGVNLEYDAKGFRARLIAGPIRYGIYPLPKREKKKTAAKPAGQKRGAESKSVQEAGEKPEPTLSPAGETKASQPKKLPTPPPPPPPEKKAQKGGSLKDFLPFVQLGMELVGHFLFRLLTFQNLYVRLILAGEDKGKLAIQYGRTWAALGNLLPLADNRFRIKKRDIQVGCDFEGSETIILVKTDIIVPLGGLVAMGVRYGIRGLMEFLKFKKKRKGGAIHESETT